MREAAAVDRFMTASEAAVYLNVEVQTLGAWRASNKYPGLRYLKIGSKVRYRKCDLDAWLESRVVGQLPK